jgi:hypothetical protein
MAHQSECTQKQPATESATDELPKKDSVESETQNAPRVPFESLIADDEVQRLFERHPRLQLQLCQIYHNTLEPDHVDRPKEARRRGSSYRGRGCGSQIYDRNDARRWTPDRGFARGLEDLRTQQQSDSPSADGLKELFALILKRYPVEARQTVFPAADISLIT